jgi:hypothetical protein
VASKRLTNLFNPDTDMPVFPRYLDAELPDEQQRAALTYLMYTAFVDIRALCLDGKPEQAKDLAEAFHNLPLMMRHPEFSMNCQRDSFARYEEKYGVREGFDYVAKLDRIATTRE